MKPDLQEYSDTVGIMLLPDELPDYNFVVDKPHVTLFYHSSIKGLPTDTQAKVENLIDAVFVDRWDKIEVRTTGIKEFGADTKCAVLTLESDDLKQLNAAIDEGMKELGLEEPKQFAYTPHMTIGYLESGEQLPEYKGDVSFTMNEVLLNYGDVQQTFLLDDEDDMDDEDEMKHLIDRALEFKVGDVDPSPLTTPQSQNPNARKLRQYWTRGKGGKLKIRWGTPGDHTRCTRHLSKYVTRPQAIRMCANYHKTITGMWPGDRRNKSDELDLDFKKELELLVKQYEDLSITSIEIKLMGAMLSDPEFLDILDTIEQDEERNDV